MFRRSRTLMRSRKASLNLARPEAETVRDVLTGIALAVALGVLTVLVVVDQVAVAALAVVRAAVWFAAISRRGRRLLQ